MARTQGSGTVLRTAHPRGQGQAKPQRRHEGPGARRSCSCENRPRHVSNEILNLITVPFFSGAIGYLTNWSGVWMLFNPIEFKGFHVPGLRPLVPLLPRKIQQIPGFMQGGGRAGRGSSPRARPRWAASRSTRGSRSSAAVATSTSSSSPTRSPSTCSRPRATTSATWSSGSWSASTRELWRDVAAAGARAGPRARAGAAAGHHPRRVADEIGSNVDQLADVKLMVIRNMEEHPELANRVFLEVGRKELRLIVNFGFIFGFLLGIPVAFLTECLPLLVAAADLRGRRRLRDEPARDLDDLRAGRAAEVRLRQVARPLPAPPGRGRRRLRARSSPTTSSRSATSATSCCTGPGPTAPAR